MRAVRYFVNNLDRILGYTAQHVVLIVMAILIAVLVWVSVGILVRNSRRMARGVLAVASLIMSVPSVALYGILVSIPGLGLSRQSAVLALVLYAMLPIIRNVYVALNGVDPAIMEAARGMGMSTRRILWRVQLPLATPVVLAGVRVSVVMMVGIATLAVFIGERNLGVLIQQGLVRTRSDMIIVGAVIVSAFSIGIDYLFGKLERLLVSPGIRGETT
ncbi:MAG: ABC transporter permease [Spirochaetaceae bacterium]|nr:MAG: ABC transporter permease [Spirochaetaceae bacterium]